MRHAQRTRSSRRSPSWPTARVSKQTPSIRSWRQMRLAKGRKCQGGGSQRDLFVDALPAHRPPPSSRHWSARASTSTTRTWSRTGTRTRTRTRTPSCSWRELSRITSNSRCSRTRKHRAHSSSPLRIRMDSKTGRNVRRAARVHVHALKPRRPLRTAWPLSRCSLSPDAPGDATRTERSVSTVSPRSPASWACRRWACKRARSRHGRGRTAHGCGRVLSNRPAWSAGGRLHLGFATRVERELELPCACMRRRVGPS